MQDLTTTLAMLTGEENSLTSFKTEVDRLAARLGAQQAAKATEKAGIIAQLKGISGLRVTTPTDDGANAERTAGQIAILTAVKGGNLSLTENEAKTLWRAAGLAVRPLDRQWLLCDPDGLLLEYQANLGLGSWEEFRTWLSVTPIEEMGI